MSRYDSQGTTMDEMDFERRRELRRQKREEMRLEAERMSKNDDDEEEAARERRRRARQERMRARELEEAAAQPECPVVTNCYSVTESVSLSSSYGGNCEDEDQALLERMAKREERRQRRLKEALERQKQSDETEGQDVSSVEKSKPVQEYGEEEQRPQYSSWRREKMYSLEREEKEEEEVRQEEEPAPVVEKVEEEKPRRSYFIEEEQAEEATHSVVNRYEAESADIVAEEATETAFLDFRTCRVLRNDNAADIEVFEMLYSEDKEVSDAMNEQSFSRNERKQNGSLYDDEQQGEEQEQEEATTMLHRKYERMSSRSNARSPEASFGDERDEDTAVRLEADLKLEELKRRRDNAESEEFERMRQKQQEAEAQLEELKRKREERKKVLEEEERQRKQEEVERRAREEEEKRKMKEEIERRRAEAAERRQKVEEPVDDEGKPFKCVSPRGSPLKIGERAEFLNKSAQKSTAKASPSHVVSKIDNRLEQYTSAAQRETKDLRCPRSAAVDIPAATDSIRNIKSMWEKGSVFSAPGNSGSSAFKEATVINPGVAGRINDWLNKTPESAKSSGGRPSDLKPVDVTNKRSLWENKGSSAAKVAGRSETKSFTNGMGH
ncbi:caldesmon 1a isoform X2 [Corythoichthys intestinalis]|uniref:caldesmon 1a isoform X2 n=1 Tax=Corythoichthys intestinalis TaxID=161448 RepID=UPI0025A4E7D0|nr:caldesmon 1a isoform X2 [Corythoichthys intestinalis]